MKTEWVEIEDSSQLRECRFKGRGTNLGSWTMVDLGDSAFEILSHNACQLLLCSVGSMNASMGGALFYLNPKS